MHVNERIKDKIQNAMTTLFGVDFELGSDLSFMDFRDASSELFHLEVLTQFLNQQGYEYCGIHETKHLGKLSKQALYKTATVGGKICVICKIEDRYLPCLVNAKGNIVEPLDTGHNEGMEILHDKSFYGWYVIRRIKSEQ